MRMMETDSCWEGDLRGKRLVRRRIVGDVEHQVFLICVLWRSIVSRRISALSVVERNLKVCYDLR